VDPPLDIGSSAATDEYVFISFKHPVATLAPRFIQSSNIPMEKVGAGVQASMKEEPSKKFYF